jgi:16S rRNA (cytidine1402-2'-O)-methyltransferase
MATLYCIGTPLYEEHLLDPQAKSILERSVLVIAESKKITYRYLSQLPQKPKDDAIFFLDPHRKEEWERLEEALKGIQKSSGIVALLSDTGMPILFDPGVEVLHLCRKLGFQIHSTIGATSWGMAAALSGFSPPFFTEGFLPRDNAERILRLKELKLVKAALILMDTPYRYQLLLKQCIETLGKRNAFLAWELTKKEEHLLWGTLPELEKVSRELKLEKGEFVLVVK